MNSKASSCGTELGATLSTTSKKILSHLASEMTFASNFDRVNWQQKQMGQTVNDWHLTGKLQFPKLFPLRSSLQIWLSSLLMSDAAARRKN